MILQDLMSAQRSKSLINIYQYNSNVFYTGYVYHLGDDGVVVSTYDQYGMSDGMVFIRLSRIYRVEFYSKDLFQMGDFIRIGKMNGLLEYTGQAPMKLIGDHDLVKQILGRSYVEKQIVMIKAAGRKMYVEGFINHVGAYNFEMTSIDKFNFSRHKKIRIFNRDVEVIEFCGKELSLLGRCKKILFGPSGMILAQTLPIFIKMGLKRAQHDQRMIEVEAYQDHNYFYLGWVKAINANYVVLKVVDMSSQFGGYVLMRLDSIQRLTIISDYLKLVKYCSKLNQKQKNFVQPVLNADREFDPTDNLAAFILRQALVLHRLVRLRTFGSAHSMMGYPSEVQAASFIFRPVKQFPQISLGRGNMIGFSNVQEIAFDYLGTFLSEKRLSTRKWWK